MNLIYLEALIRSDPFNPLHHIALAKAYLEGGDEERARKVVAIKRRLPSKEPTVHFEWGKLCEELGMARQAIESYEQAIALSPNQGEYHFRIAQLFFEKGAWERAMKHLQKTLSLIPQSQKAKEMLAFLYQEMGLKGLSERLIPTRSIKPPASPQVRMTLTKDDVRTVKNLFQGKEIGYAEYRIDDKGNLIPNYIPRSWEEGELRRHLLGEIFLGGYPLRSDRTLIYSVIWVHIPNRKIFANIKNEGFLALTENHIHSYAKTIHDVVKGYGIPVYLENFGGRGRRLWFFFEDFIPVDLAERFLHEVLDKASSPGVDLAIDLHLGIKGAGLGWTEDPVPLPLGINPLTLKRCFFIDREGESFENQLLFMQKIRPIEWNQIKLLLKRDRPLNGMTKMGSLLNRLETRCPVFADILWKARSGRSLQVHEKLMIFFTLGFIEEGKHLIHRILEPCPDYRPRRVDRMIKRIRGKPISCPKIRQLMPERTAYLRCNCTFEIPEGGYPTPFLHIRG